MRRRLGFLLTALTPGLTMLGCVSVGRNFVRPEDSTLTLGKTTLSEITERFGPEPKEGTLIHHGKNIKTVTYVYARSSLIGNAHVSGVTPARAVGFCFFGDLLVGYDFSSSFKEDHTDFEDAKVAQIQERVTTRREVESLLGPPQGKQIHPMVEGEDEQGLVYAYGQWKEGPGFYTKTLVVILGPDGVVRKVSFSSQGSR